MLSLIIILIIETIMDDGMKIYLFKGKCNGSGLRIRKAREQMHLSQEQLAAKLQLEGLEITQKTISRIETGLRIIPDYELPFFARALEHDISWIVQDINFKNEG